MKIILIGFMGSGKTTVGRLLAKKLNFDFVEMDKLIIGQQGKTINQIFNEVGEEGFRLLESQISKDLRKKENVVISTGGGVVINKINTDNLKKNGTIVFLKTSFSEIKKRLKHAADRPLFRNLKSAEALFNIRQNLYTESADLVVNTDGKSVERITNEIISQN